MDYDPTDVREPSEVALGSIPSSVNLPLQGFEKSLSLDEGMSTILHPLLPIFSSPPRRLTAADATLPSRRSLSLPDDLSNPRG